MGLTVNRQMALKLTVNRQKRNIFTVNRQMSEPKLAVKPAAGWPSPDFPQFFCPAANPRACTDLHLVWACKL